MSPRDKVLVQAGAVVQSWRRAAAALPQSLEESIRALWSAIEAMNSEARSRAGDPSTSRQGPSSFRMNKRRREILDLLKSRPLTDIEIVSAMESKISASGARTRRAELVKMGLVRDSGRRRRSDTGRLHIVWQVA